MFQVSSIKTTCFQKWIKETWEKQTAFRGLGLIHDNAYAHKCKLVQDSLETETEVQLHNSPYSSDLNPVSFSCLL